MCMNVNTRLVLAMFTAFAAACSGPVTSAADSGAGAGASSGAAISVCEKAIECAGVGDKQQCHLVTTGDTGVAPTKCASELGAWALCVDTKGSCDPKTKSYSAVGKCDAEIAAFIVCYGDGGTGPGDGGT